MANTNVEKQKSEIAQLLANAKTPEDFDTIREKVASMKKSLPSAGTVSSAINAVLREIHKIMDSNDFDDLKSQIENDLEQLSLSNYEKNARDYSIAKGRGRKSSKK